MLSDFTAEQRNSLQLMLPMLGLAADLAHGIVTIYLPCNDKKFLNILKQAKPLTQLSNDYPDLTGRRVRIAEEPLVARALQKNITVIGKRERRLGSFYNLQVYPLRDNRGRAYGVVSFETGNTDPLFIAKSFEMLCNSDIHNTATSKAHYQRMQPSDGIMLVDLDKTIIAANNRARHMFDVMEIPDIVGYRTSDVAINWPLVGMVMDTGIAESKEFKMHGLLLSMRVLPVVPKPRGGCAVVILKDITELRKKDEELLIKSVVIKEIHHRVKNNLQTIASLLRLQERRTQNSETKTVLRDCIGRVNSIAIVHEYLSQQDTGLIDVGKVAKGIYQAIISSMLAYDFVLETHFSAAEVQFPSDKATNIALILNELLQNAIEHAFVGRNHGSLQVDFTEEVDKYTLSIIDDGIGLPKDFQITGRKSLGLKIIKTMAESDLHGSFILRNNAQGGTQALVTIPKAGEL